MKRSRASSVVPLVTMTMLQGCSPERGNGRTGGGGAEANSEDRTPARQALHLQLRLPRRLTYSEWKAGRGELSRFRVQGLRAREAGSWVEEPTRVHRLADSLEGILYDPSLQSLRSAAYEELEVEFTSGEVRAVKLHINPPAKVWSLLFEGEGTLYCDSRIEALLREIYDLPPAYVSGSLRSGDDE